MIGARLIGIRSPIVRGAFLGAITGLSLSAFYGFAVIALLVGAMLIPSTGTLASDYLIQLSMASVTATCAIPCVGLLGIAPGILWGVILGLILGGVETVLHKHLRTATAALLGVAVSTVFALLLHYLIPFYESIAEPSGIRTYFLYQGVPSLISIGAGGWMGWQLYRTKCVIPNEALTTATPNGSCP